MVKAQKVDQGKGSDSGAVCFVSRKSRQLIGELCIPCNTRLKGICESNGNVVDSGLAEALRAGRAR